MKKMFCPECGKKHEFNHAAPNFCSGCGSSLTGKPAPSRSSSSNEEYEDEELKDDETDIDEVPDLEKIELEDEIEVGAKSQITLGDILQKPTRPDYVHDSTPQDIRER